MPRQIVALIILLFAGQVRAQEVDAKALKELVPMAQGFFKCSFFVRGDLDPSLNVQIVGEVVDYSPEISAIKKSLLKDPQDIELYFRLCELPAPANSQEEATARIVDLAARCVELAKRQHAKNPNDPRAIFQLGKAYLYASEYQTATQYLRPATKLLPNDATVWALLSRSLFNEAYHELTGRDKFAPHLEFDALLRHLSENSPTANAIATHSRLMSEAAACLDQAVKVGPENGNSYLIRGSFKFHRDGQAAALRVAAGQKFDNLEFLKKLLGEVDFQTAAKYSPSCPRILAFATNCIVMEHIMTAKEAFDLRRPIRLSPATQAVVEGRNKQLDSLMSHQDNLIATEARCFRALNHVFIDKDFARAATLLREAVQRRPEHNLSFDLLCTSLSLTSGWNELQSIAEARLSMKDRDNIWNRYAAARAAFELKQYDRAEKHLRAGLQVDPKSCLGNLALASVMLKNYDKSRSDEIRELLFKADVNIPSPLMGGAGWQFDASLLRSILCAFEGDVEFSRRNLRELLSREPNNEKAEKVAQLIGK